MMEPYTIHFPVNFTAAGDRTRQAVSKHIQEFAALASYTGEIVSALGGLEEEIGKAEESAGDAAWTFEIDGEEF
jgi:hypothetical protein